MRDRVLVGACVRVSERQTLRSSRKSSYLLLSLTHTLACASLLVCLLASRLSVQSATVTRDPEVVHVRALMPRSHLALALVLDRVRMWHTCTHLHHTPRHALLYWIRCDRQGNFVDAAFVPPEAPDPDVEASGYAPSDRKDRPSTVDLRGCLLDHSAMARLARGLGGNVRLCVCGAYLLCCAASIPSRQTPLQVLQS